MSKAQRKPRPSVPKWAWYAYDLCWCCNNRNNCNRCKICKKIVANQKSKQIKRYKRKSIQEGLNEYHGGHFESTEE